MVDLSNFRGENGTVYDNAKRYIVDGTVIFVTAAIMFAQTSRMTATLFTGIISIMIILIMNRLRKSNEIKEFAIVKEENIHFLRNETVGDNYPRLKYRSRDENEKKCVVHFGQIKLLMSEISFMIKYGELANVVVYAGAAPGHHILKLGMHLTFFNCLQFVYSFC